MACACAPTAQRRPARPGRQLSPPMTCKPLADARSTKAGPAGPATRLPFDEGLVAGGHRSTKAGPAGPATHAPRAVVIAVATSAQRRPARPGRQLGEREPAVAVPGARSTKAGPAGPATPAALGPAGWAERERSTKAGPAGPATPPTWPTTATPPTALNEGRPGRAGNSLSTVNVIGPPHHAQRRPARPGRQLCPTSTIEASRHMGNMSWCAKCAEK